MEFYKKNYFGKNICTPKCRLSNKKFNNKILSDKDIIKLSTKKEITLHLLDNNDTLDKIKGYIENGEFLSPRVKIS